MSKVTSYLEEVNKEMRKVSWPHRHELISNTVITLIASVVIAVFIWGADHVITFVLEGIYQ